MGTRFYTGPVKLRPSHLVCAVAVLCLVAAVPIGAQRSQSPHPDLQGIWLGATLTPLQRPADFKDRATFTPEEAAEYIRTSADRIRKRLPSDADRLLQVDVDDTYVEVENLKLDGGLGSTSKQFTLMIRPNSTPYVTSSNTTRPLVRANP